MTSATLPASFTSEGFESWLAQQSEPDWLTDLRRAAWSEFEQMKWPDRGQEEWMRSDLRPFKLLRYPLPGGTPIGSSASPQDSAAQAAGNLGQSDGASVGGREGGNREGTIPQWLSEGLELAGQVETRDGLVVKSHLSQQWRDKGVIFGDLSQLAGEHEELVRTALFSVVDPHQDRFAALHAATWSGGQLLYVPRGVSLTQPVHVLNGITEGGTDTGHTLIILDEGAEATFLHEADSAIGASGGFHCGSVEIIVKPNAHLRYVNLQDWGRGVWHIAHQRATIDRNATIQWTIAAMGGRFVQVSQQVALIGKGAHSQVNGVMFTQDSQHLTYNTLQHHIAPQCRSDFLYKAALQDQSRTVWRGMIQVDKAAQKTDGYQRNDNLLLSQQSRADSIPGLEILADDVRCTHGSTSGRVDEELIFYAQSRGFTRKEAVRLIVTGFFQQIFDRITIDSVREALGQSIARQVREYQ